MWNPLALACREARSVSTVMPNFPAIEQIAAHCEGCSPLVVEHHPNRSLADLLRVPPSSVHSSILLSTIGASKEPGTVQLDMRADLD
jgi:hypothetical protein